MLPRGEALLLRMRAGPGAWAGLAEASTRDLVLRELQYDLRPQDEPLVRRLLELEADAREQEEDMVESTRLAGWLLASFGRVSDLPLMLRTKHASYDTFCGFETEFLFAAGVEATVAQATEAQREDLLGEDGLPLVDEEDLTIWREGMRRMFPPDPAQEHPLSNAAHAAWHGDTEATRQWLQRWSPSERERGWVGTILDDLERRGGEAGIHAAAELRSRLLS